MKKIIITLLFLFIFSLVLTPVLAEEEGDDSNDRISNIKNKVQTVLEKRTENISSKATALQNKKEENRIKVKNSILARWNAYNKLIVRSEQLLDKLQMRMDKAKVAGENTAEMEKQMTDARAKLADAKLKMDGLKSLVGTDLDKNGFKDAQKNLQAVHKDLNIVKQDASKIIRNLKSFNSEKDSTKSATRSATER